MTHPILSNIAYIAPLQSSLKFAPESCRKFFHQHLQDFNSTENTTINSPKTPSRRGFLSSMQSLWFPSRMSYGLWMYRVLACPHARRRDTFLSTLDALLLMDSSLHPESSAHKNFSGTQLLRQWQTILLQRVDRDRVMPHTDFGRDLQQNNCVDELALWMHLLHDTEISHKIRKTIFLLFIREEDACGPLLSQLERLLVLNILENGGKVLQVSAKEWTPLYVLPLSANIIHWDPTQEASLSLRSIFTAYLQVSLHCKAHLPLARIFNSPPRGLSRHAFTALRHLAQQGGSGGLTLMQVAQSFVGRLRLGASQNEHPLFPYRAGLRLLVQLLETVQQTLEGGAEEEELERVEKLKAAMKKGRVTALQGEASSLSSPRSQALHRVVRCFQRLTRELQEAAQHDSVKVSGFGGEDVWRWTFQDLTKERDAWIAMAKHVFPGWQTEQEVAELHTTPGRTMSSGASVQGRPAMLLLRSVIDAMVTGAPHHNLAIPTHSSPKTPRATPGRTPQRSHLGNSPSGVSKTPEALQTARNWKKRLYGTPKTPQTPTPVERGKHDQHATGPTGVMPTNHSSAQPAQPVFAKFQSNLEWKNLPSNNPQLRHDAIVTSLASARSVDLRETEVYGLSVANLSKEEELKENVCEAAVEKVSNRKRGSLQPTEKNGTGNKKPSTARSQSVATKKKKTTPQPSEVVEKSKNRVGTSTSSASGKGQTLLTNFFK